MRIQTIAIASAAALVLMTAAGAQTLYRCTGADGKVAYQDRPCATGAQQAERRIDSTPVDPAARRAAQARAERDKIEVEQVERREQLEKLERQAQQDRATLRARIDKSGQNSTANYCAHIEKWIKRHENNMRAGQSRSGMEWNRQELEYERSRFERECR